MPTTSEKRATFRRLHDKGFFIIPNAWDAGSAVRLAKLGFKAIAYDQLRGGLGRRQGRRRHEPRRGARSSQDARRCH